MQLTPSGIMFHISCKTSKVDLRVESLLNGPQLNVGTLANIEILKEQRHQNYTKSNVF